MDKFHARKHPEYPRSSFCWSQLWDKGAYWQRLRCWETAHTAQHRPPAKYGPFKISTGLRLRIRSRLKRMPITTGIQLREEITPLSAPRENHPRPTKALVSRQGGIQYPVYSTVQENSWVSLPQQGDLNVCPSARDSSAEGEGVLIYLLENW